MTAPLIGITSFRQINRYQLSEIALPETYVQAISRAGGIPLIVPGGLPGEQLSEMISAVDAVLFSGGGDVETRCYGVPSTPKVNNVDPDRDRVEIRLVREAVSAGVPFLGICRGLQVINVALGGTLHRDIEDEIPGAHKHDYYPDWSRDHRAHVVELQADSTLASILGMTQPQVNSLHHQAINQVAPDLQVVANAPDGIIEGIELPGHPFGMAVQWHPECLPEHESMRALFRAFVNAAKGNSKRES
jgi:putative glutamine amidotransferase